MLRLKLKNYFYKEKLLKGIIVKIITKKLMPSYKMLIFAGFNQYWSDKDKPKALFRSSFGSLTFNLCKRRSNLSCQAGIFL